MDETYVKVKKPKYLYRAVDLDGNTLNFLLIAKRDTQATKRFFRKAMNAIYTQYPPVINVDKNAAYSKTVDELEEKEELSKRVALRQKKHLNNHS